MRDTLPAATAAADARAAARGIGAIEAELDGVPPEDPRAAARRLLRLAEEVLETWIAARGEAPTAGEREGFRLLALHHQGARGTPSFNACRETCREVAYHYNMVMTGRGEAVQLTQMMTLLVRHLALFVGGKLQVEGLGDFCCASRPLRQDASPIARSIDNGEPHA